MLESDCKKFSLKDNYRTTNKYGKFLTTAYIKMIITLVELHTLFTQLGIFIDQKLSFKSHIEK